MCLTVFFAVAFLGAVFFFITIFSRAENMTYCQALHYRLNFLRKTFLTVSTRKRYAAIKMTRMPKYRSGGTVSPKAGAIGVKGSMMPTRVKEMQVIASHLPGRLTKNGVRAVRITNTTRISVAIDSINQPVWKSEPFAWKIKSMTLKVAKSKIDESGPKNSM